MVSEGFQDEFDFGHLAQVPASCKHTCHIFYGMRVVDMTDDLPKWADHKNKSVHL